MVRCGENERWVEDVILQIKLIRCKPAEFLNASHPLEDLRALNRAPCQKSEKHLCQFGTLSFLDLDFSKSSTNLSRFEDINENL